MSKLKKLIAAQAALLFASFGAAGAQGPAPVTPPSGSGDRNVLLQDQVRRAWRQALAVRDDNPISCVAPDSAVPAPDSRRPIIVIDLGHRFQTGSGVIDDGTVNENAGLVEADIIDAVGARLASILRARGYDVILTRNPGEPLPVARGDYKASLSSRGQMPAYLAQETGRPVVLLSLHVDNMRRGGAVYVQNNSDGVAQQDSLDLARAVAASYRIGSEGANVNPGMDVFKGRGRFDNRMLRSFEAARRTCHAVDGAAALVELGDIRDPADIASFRQMMQNADPTATRIADGLGNFISQHYPAPVPPTLRPPLPSAGPAANLTQ